jgi:hypothetical protein
MFYFTGTEATEGAQLYHPEEGSISKKSCIFLYNIKKNHVECVAGHHS